MVRIAKPGIKPLLFQVKGQHETVLWKMETLKENWRDGMEMEETQSEETCPHCATQDFAYVGVKTNKYLLRCTNNDCGRYF